jgi:hypothetical protein
MTPKSKPALDSCLYALRGLQSLEERERCLAMILSELIHGGHANSPLRRDNRCRDSMSDESLKLELLGRTVSINVLCNDRLIAKTMYDSLLEQCTRMALSSDSSTRSLT